MESFWGHRNYSTLLGRLQGQCPQDSGLLGGQAPGFPFLSTISSVDRRTSTFLELDEHDKHPLSSEIQSLILTPWQAPSMFSTLNLLRSAHTGRQAEGLGTRDCGATHSCDLPPFSSSYLLLSSISTARKQASKEVRIMQGAHSEAGLQPI